MNRISFRFAMLATVVWSAEAVAGDPKSFTPAEQELVATLRTGKYGSSRIAAARQMDNRDGRFLDVLADAMTDADPEIRAAAVKTIGDVGTIRAVYTLQAFADDPVQDRVTRLMACRQIGVIGADLRKDGPLASLLSLSRSVEKDVARQASIELDKAIRSFNAKTLDRLAGSSVDGIAAEVQAPKSGGAKRAMAAFPPADLAAIDTWRKDQQEPLAEAIKGYQRLLATIKPTDVDRLAVRDQLNNSAVARGRLGTLSPAEAGATMYQQARELLGASFSLWEGVRGVDKPSDELPAAVDADPTGPTSLGRLLAKVDRQQTTSTAARATRLRDSLLSLSPATKTVVAERLDKDRQPPK